jgi:class 3 adenylate cyclase/tetratricopeptide (TPR) repeat protein
MRPCPRCGQPSDERARFCSACGFSLPGRGPSAGAFRKTVTVIFSDVAGSTALGERLDPESVRRVMARYFDEACGVLERHGGTVEKFIGDAVMAAFGIPTLHEDDALRAVKAAEELRGRIAALDEELERDWGVRIEARIGVNTGEVVAGEPSEGHAFATGDAVNVAARLQQAAAPGEILVGAATYRLVRDAARLEPIEPLVLKGKAELVSAWRLVHVFPDVPAFTKPLEAPFVGRQREVAELQAAFERAASTGVCHLRTVLGPPGVGKSRLARELLSAIGDRARIVVGRCPSYGEGITYWPLAQIVKQAAGTEFAALEELVAREADADLITQGLMGAVGLAGTDARAEEIFWAVRRLFETLARERPLIAVIDDIHWAEPTFLDLLEYVTNFGRARILLLCIARPDLLDARPTWGTPRENAGLLGLHPLSDSEADTLMEALLSGPDLSEPLRRRILSAAEGNPLFVEQMVALAREADREDGQLEVPPTIQALLAARIDRLDAGERGVLERASVEGRLFHRGALSTLLPEAERERLPTHLMGLVRKELIRPDQSEFAGEDGFRFAHTLIRDAAYEAMSKELRAELHERFADWREAKSPDVEEVVGYHLEQAVRYRSRLPGRDEHRDDVARRAWERLGSAGRRAFARGDMPAAANLLERATSLMPPEEPARLELRIDLGTALTQMGQLARAGAIFDEEIERASSKRDLRLEWRARLQRSFLSRYAHPEEGGEELLGVAKEAIRAFGEVGDDAGLARAWRLVAAVHWTRCQIGRTEAALESALSHARRAGEEREALLTLSGLARAALAGPTPVDEALLRCEGLVEQTPGSRTFEADVAMIQAYLEAMRGRFREARDLYREAAATRRDLGQTVDLAASQAWMGEVEMLADDPAAAEDLRRPAFETLEAIGERGILSCIAAYLADTLYVLGRHEEAARLTVTSEESAAADDVTAQILWRTTRARVLAARGALDEAQELARRAVALARRTDYLNLHAEALMSLADVRSAAGSPDDAAAAAHDALELYEAKGNLVSADRARAWLERRAVTAGASRDGRAS